MSFRKSNCNKYEDLFYNTYPKIFYWLKLIRKKDSHPSHFMPPWDKSPAYYLAFYMQKTEIRTEPNLFFWWYYKPNHICSTRYIQIWNVFNQISKLKSCKHCISIREAFLWNNVLTPWQKYIDGLSKCRSATKLKSFSVGNEVTSF